ncbi:MAG TPA: ATP synthase F1 subunit gamma [Dehalococcoidia bacterium]|nr:ATP synthase F1 subunit gamma [Dehalococcoidia bacterium]
MANIRIIRRRIRSVQSTAKITKAMELVAASKMRRAQERALAGRPYAEQLREVLSHLAEQTGGDIDPTGATVLHPLLVQRSPVRRALIIEITTDRGLCGGLNANLNRRTAALALELRGQGIEVSLVNVGRKGREFFGRTGYPIEAEFANLPDYPAMADTLAISHVAVTDFLEGRADRVLIVYPRFINTTIQRPEVLQLLPVQPPETTETITAKYADYIFEPSPEEVLETLVPRYVETQLYVTVLEKAASEQSARMVAMRNASDAAADMIQDLTLTYNKTRQEQITKELLDVVGGAQALTR